MKESLNLRLGSEIKDKNKKQENLNYKMAVQDALNEFSTFETLASFKSYGDEEFFNKVKNSDLKKFEEYHESYGRTIDVGDIDKAYPGFVAKFNRLIEKIRTGDITRDEIAFEIKTLRAEASDAIAA